MMKRALLAALLAAVLLLGAAARPALTYAESVAPTHRPLSVTGHGKLEVKPDTAVISLGVSQLKPTPAEAYKAMSADLLRISGSVQAMGIKQEQIETGLFNLAAEYNWTQDKGQVLSGYRATNMLRITTRDLESVAALVQTAVESGANQLNGISFQVKDTDELMEQALDLAVADAKAKAERVAGKLDAKIVGVLSISIQDQGVPVYRTDGYAAGAAGKAEAMAPAPVYGGLSTFTATVSVTFEIQ